MGLSRCPQDHLLHIQEEGVDTVVAGHLEVGATVGEQYVIVFRLRSRPADQEAGPLQGEGLHAA